MYTPCVVGSSPAAAAHSRDELVSEIEERPGAVGAVLEPTGLRLRVRALAS